MARSLKLFVALVITLMAATVAKAQITTAEMTGKIVASDSPVIGATIMAVHEPSGTSYGTITNVDGLFTLQGMRTGGPYKVTISYVGYQTVVYKDITLQLGDTYKLNVTLKESSEILDEIVVTGTKTKFNTEKTGATTNISSKEITLLPSVNRSIEDLARLSPYASGMSFAGGDGRSTNFTIDGANFNNNFGLSDQLPGGGSPISMDALEEVQVVIAPFDVRQTNFIGGGINAVTKSGTNTFKGTAYTYQYNQQMRGNKIDGENLGERTPEAKHVYGATFGGPIIKNKLFFFANVEFEQVPQEVTKWRARKDGEAPNSEAYISEASESDLLLVKNHLKDKYGYDTGSFTDFPKDETNMKILGRIDWNINTKNKLSLRYNYTLNKSWFTPNGSSSDTGYRLNGTYRIGENSMSYANSFYSMDNKVNSISADLNSRFTDKISNQLLFTFTAIKDMRGSNSEPFPFIDIMQGKDENGEQIMKPYISAGYELFTWNNGVNNNIYTLTDNFTYYAGKHKITAGFNYEHQFANNSYMRNGTGYYRYNSVQDFLSGAAPESFALTYGYGGELEPAAQVTFDQIGFYAQDEWSIVDRFKLTYGIRLDQLFFNEKDVKTNNAILSYCFNGKHIDTGKWPTSKMQYSPRVGFVWDVMGDKSLKVRGGTGIFTGRLPLVFLTNMPTNSGMIQNLVRIQSTYKDGKLINSDPRLNLLKGGMITNVNDMIKALGLPTDITPDQHYAPSSIAGVDRDFRMPQVWKSSIAVDYQIPVSFPFTVTGEFMYTENIFGVKLENYNIKPSDNWERFNGPDNRLIYPTDYKYYNEIADACVLTNTKEGWGYTANLTLNAQPVKDLNIMAAYTHTEFKEISGMPGNNAASAWQSLLTVNGPNYATLQRSEYVVPDKVIASLSYSIPYLRNHMATHLSLFYTGYSPYGNSYYYTNDMNGDGIAYDLMYIPKDDSEIKFKDEADRKPFWDFVNQDSYLKNNKGKYAEAYSARAPWVHRFDFRIAQDFRIKAGKTTNTLQISLDFLNIGNMFKSTWGVSQTNRLSNSGRLLTYEGMDENKNPIFSLYRDKQGNPATQTYTYDKDYSECWKFQIGVRYIFN